MKPATIGFPAIRKLKDSGDDAPIVQELGDYNPCLTSKNMCHNRGKCINRNGQFICQCPPTHFGKRCERIADTRFCKNHKCQNGGTCISTEEERTFVDPILLRQYKELHNGSSVLETDGNITVTIQYQCVCVDGFIGEFCHLSEAERNCEEEYCNSHGKGRYDLENGCTCECDPNEWLGEKCDIRSPCADYSCVNTATCTLEYHLEEVAVEAICICPSNTELINTTIGGDHCENIETNDEKSEFIPCKQSSNFVAWFMKMSTELRDEDLKDLEMIENSCVKLNGENCSVDGVLKNGWCYHEGKCNVRVEKFDSGKLYLVPFCECKGADSGRFCEYHRKDACDPTPVEKERGVTRENRCTSLLSGVCIAPEGVPLCDCLLRPQKIQIPDDIEIRGDVSAQNYRCLCGMGDSIDEKNTAEIKCVYTGTGNCSLANNPCNHGECLACEHDDEGDILQLCSDQDKSNGFRCVCEPGFLPPYCRTPEDACHNHLFVNAFREHLVLCVNTLPITAKPSVIACASTAIAMKIQRLLANFRAIAILDTTVVIVNLNTLYSKQTCNGPRKGYEEKDDDYVDLESIRHRKLKVALEQKMNVIRKKVHLPRTAIDQPRSATDLARARNMWRAIFSLNSEDNQRRLAALVAKLRTPTKIELKAIPSPINALEPSNGSVDAAGTASAAAPAKE
ncbi:hypothetical protein KIN20_004700 [Parelaphostrongylus tenuis]|uniref:EGF-like domain-containing protein n=1 Tax=Parelaphostrongylus tenuis TaxID=148309 RepID=A0AAD5QFC5_PARTN|nr:hypothetical protein KIN20_004700 [Parelaphostrongylus tenuis]